MGSFSIQIPQPCHERWADMQPTERGRFCASCQKTVVDFTGLSDAEIIRLLSRHPETTCGRLRNEQLNRPLYVSEPGSGPVWRHWLSLVALGLFGWQTARAQVSRPTRHPQLMAQRQTPVSAGISVAPIPVETAGGPEKMWTITGRALLQDSVGNITPLSGADVALGGFKTQTDSAGAFTVSFPKLTRATDLTVFVSALNRIHNRSRIHERITFDVSPFMSSITLPDLVINAPTWAPARNITGGGLMIVRKPSLWQKVKRKLFR
ncbi:hypothetical protein [Spirosoma koreense]